MRARATAAPSRRCGAGRRSSSPRRRLPSRCRCRRAPIAKPMSACASAGASLMPSPVIAGRAMAGLQRLDGCELVLAAAGRRAPRRCRPRAAIALRGGLVVAGQHHRRDAQRLQLGHGLARRWLDGVGHGEQRRARRRVDASRRDGAAVLLRGRAARLRAAASTGRVPRSGGGCRARSSCRRCAPATPRPGSALKSLDLDAVRPQARRRSRATPGDPSAPPAPRRCVAHRGARRRRRPATASRPAWACLR